VIGLNISQSTIQNLVNLVEGNVQLGWSKWWLENANTLEQEVSRADFLRMKFNFCAGVSKYLTKIGVTHTLSERAKIIDAEAVYHDSMKDENGNLDKNLLDKTWKGAITQFNRGDTDKAMVIVRTELARALRSKNQAKFEELTFSIEKLFDIGEKPFALACMKEVAEINLSGSNLIETHDDMPNAPIDRAREILNRYVSK